jgi:hypothetical protein
MLQIKTISFFFLLLCSSALQAQKLKPGFDPSEYAALLSIAFNGSSIGDSVLRKTSADPYHREYQSPEVGLKNRWTLYLRPDNVAVIDLRGTINHPASWVANFYAAMIPAKGSIQVNDSTTFEYQFASNPKAMVHAGWTVSIAHLAPTILQKISAYYKDKGVREFLIIGHSQGGALAFLLRSYLEYEKQKGTIPADILLKTYCSAGPKPGNMYYAYDFDFITRGGWAFNVVNTADWVPETPFTVQTINDFNPTNPIVHAKTILKKQKFLIRHAGGYLYNQLEKKPRKAQKKFEKYLGRMIFKKSVHKTLPQLKEPLYVKGNNYMRAGTPVMLMADDEYYTKFAESNTNFFVHHMYAAYSYLLKKWYKVQ